MDQKEPSFESEWRARFDRFAARGGSEATISGWSEHGLQRRLEVIRGILDDYPAPPAARLVDLGCGTGVYCVEMAARGYRPVGADFSVGMLRRARSIAPELFFCAADLNRLPFADASFDGLVTIGVLQHLATVDQALAEMARVLRPGATAAIITLNRWSCHALAAALIAWPRAWLRGRLRPKKHAVRRGPGALAALAAARGFELAEIRGVWLFPRFLRFMERLLAGLEGLRLPGARRPLLLPAANAFALVLRRR
ncbi:MAG: methyltransferase domain-containing protein [Acidimicrobiales bacterium]|nr:methyltransferase domain-containing protein [Acidimicrobiales bacterium]MCB9834083.1 methyltransferase domain-containing protein [Planctomycetota bacterium]